MPVPRIGRTTNSSVKATTFPTTMRTEQNATAWTKDPRALALMELFAQSHRA